MPVITNADVQSLPDILASDRFVLNLGSIPGSGDSRSLSIKCMDAMMSGYSNEAFPVPLNTHTRMFRGRKTYPRTLQIQYVEDVGVDTNYRLRKWMEDIVGTDSGSSNGYIADYAITSQLEVYDTAGALADLGAYFRFFPIDVQGYSMNGQQSNPVVISCTFSFDYCKFNNTPTR